MKIKFEWREEIEGLLRKPKEVGPHYDSQSINMNMGDYSYGFDTEEQAISNFHRFKAEYGFMVPSKLVLIKTFEV